MSREADQRLADACVAFARLAWAVPIVFAIAWALAWKFGLRNGLLLLGHGVALGAGAWMMEVHERLVVSRRGGTPARAGYALSIGMTGALLLALYPLVRALLDSPEPFISALESADPLTRLAHIMAVAYALGSGALIALLVALRDLARELEVSVGGLLPAMVAALALAPVAAGLHLAYALREDLADQRHVLALFLIAGSLAVARPAAAHLQRIAAKLRAVDGSQ
jgi:hypothetical protein